MLRVSFTLRDINDWIYSFQRRAETYTNPEAVKLSLNAAKALEESFNWNVSKGCPMDAEFVATDDYIT